MISGTSVDAAEAALCEISGTGDRLRCVLIAHVSAPFSAELRRRILGAQSPQDVCALNAELGEQFAAAALEVIAKARVSPDGIDIIGSHGQTVAHLPKPLSPTNSTLQIGEASIIAERTGIPTVSDFRTRDMAVGGQGAPLVPYFDWAVLRKTGAVRAFQNLGGIANVSIIGDRLEDTLAFDTGPGNMILDALARRITQGQLSCDLDGTLSARGSIIRELLDELLRHPFFAQPPPRSAGRESFGDALVDSLWTRFGDRPYDLITTAAELTVEATAQALERWVLPRFSLEGVYVSGGGCRNPRLMDGFAKRLPRLRWAKLDVLGFSEAAKEAACFALMASEFLSGTPQNVPSATGASRAVVLGKLAP